MCVCVCIQAWVAEASIYPSFLTFQVAGVSCDWSSLKAVWSEKTQARREGLVHTRSAHTRDHKHSREWDISVPDAAAGTLSGKRNIKALGAGGREQGSICGTPVGLRSLELLGPEISAMGNSNSKKKTQANLTSSRRTSRVKSIWHFRHVDKFKTGRKICILQLQSVYILHIVNYKFKIGGSKVKI